MRLLPGWRNGRRGGLKSRCPSGRAGSNPAPGTEESKSDTLAWIGSQHSEPRRAITLRGSYLLCKEKAASDLPSILGHLSLWSLHQSRPRPRHPSFLQHRRLSRSKYLHPSWVLLL